MKESLNLKELKQSDCLLGIYLDSTPIGNIAAECFYSIANQSKPVDVLLITNGLNDNQIENIKNILDQPYYITRKRAENGEITEEVINSEKKVNYYIYKSDEELNVSKIFNTVFNAAVSNEYENISIAEIEDTFSVRWFETASRYEKENQNISIFLPLVRNTINGTLMGFLNDAAWAEGFAEEAGKFDVNLLLRFNCIIPLGALYRVSTIKEYSEEVDGWYMPMKESIKLSHYYEFFLRMIYNDLKAMTIPRMGYEMRIVRKDTYKDSTCKLPQDLTALPAEKGGVSPDEARWYFDVAKKEYFFDTDRKKVYEKAGQ